MSVLLIGADGCSSDPNVEGAKLDLRNKDYDRALENVNTALENDPDNAEAHELKGRILQEQAFTVSDIDQHTEMINEMMDAYERAIELDPGMTDEIQQRLRLAYYNEFQRGGQAFNRGREDDTQYASAARYFGNAARIQPDSAGAYVNQGYAYYNAGEYEAAMEPLNRAIEMGDSDPDTYGFLATLYLQNDRGAEAIPLLEEALEQYQGNAELQSQLLNAYVQADQLDRARDKYTELVSTEPDNKMYRYNLGSLYLQAEDYDQAIEQLAEAVRIDPAYAVAQYNLGASYVNKAYEVNQEIGEMDDRLRDERNNLSDAQVEAREAEIEVRVEMRRDLYQQAIEPLERARQLMEAEGEDVSQVCNALFTAYLQVGREDEAREAAECAGIELN